MGWNEPPRSFVIPNPISYCSFASQGWNLVTVWGVCPLKAFCAVTEPRKTQWLVGRWSMGVQQTPSVVEASLGVSNSLYGYQDRNEQTSSTALCEQNSPFLFHPDLKLDTKEIKNWVGAGVQRKRQRWPMAMIMYHCINVWNHQRIN